MDRYAPLHKPCADVPIILCHDPFLLTTPRLELAFFP